MNQHDIDWTQAPDGTTHAGIVCGTDLFFYKDVGANYYTVFADDKWYTHPGPPAALELIPRPVTPPQVPAERPTQAILDAWMIEIATLTGCLYTWMESEGYKPIYDYIADGMAGMDAQRGGCLRLSIAVFRILDRIVDWESREAGVFSYDHLEDVGQGIPFVLTEEMNKGHWAELAGNYIIPDKLEQWLTDYVRNAPDLRLLHDPERDAAVERFANEMDVPRAIAERAYDLGWRKSA